MGMGYSEPLSRFRIEHIKSESLACRNEHMEKRTIKALRINRDAIYCVADISVLVARL